MKKDDAIEQLAKLLNISDEAIAIAEGYSILPPRLQAHITMLIGDYLGQEYPVLHRLFANASREDQLRFNRIIERAQKDARRNRPDN